MELRPFRGWRYAAREVGRLIAPPYDILSSSDKQALEARDPRNIVAVDLPHCPPAQAGPDEVYASSAATLRQWLAAGVLARDEKPCLYAYRQTFSLLRRQDHPLVRRAILGAVRLAEFGQGVWPHEKTLPGPRADRLKVTAATSMQLSPIFGLYEDDGSAADALFRAAGADRRAADQSGSLRGVKEELWTVSDPRATAAVCAAMSGRALLVADGHHRYTTCLAWRQGLGDLSADHPANFVMFVLVGMTDPGLVVLPTHRVVTGLEEFDLEGFVNATRRVVEYHPVSFTPDDADDADAFLRPFGPHAMALVSPAGAGEVTAHVGVVKDPSLLEKVALELTAPLRQLDVCILHRLILDHFMLDCWRPETAVEYLADGRAALAAVRSGRADLAIFLQATALPAVRDIALSGQVMPPKSTYFFPKPATGLVLYDLRP